jgi:hypothetical protein
MKFRGHKDINKPREEVVKYFADPQYLGEYQTGFIKKVLISGEMGQTDAVSEMHYTHNGRDMLLEETITSNCLPDTFDASYHHVHMDNTMKCTFEEIDSNLTRYRYEFEYTRINWFMPKLIAILFPSMYKKQAEKWMQNFKEFVERQ